MGRKSKLTPEQWAEVDRRLLEGDAIRRVAADYPITEASIRARLAKIGKREDVQQVAAKIVDAQRSLEALPISARVIAQNLADKLRSISDSLASAAELGAKTAHRLQHLANSEVGKVDDADPLQSMEALKGVSALTRLANDSSHIALNLLAANKEKAQSFAAEGDGPSAAPELAITVTRRAARA